MGNLMPLLGVFSLQREIMVRERASKTFRMSSFYLSRVLTEIPIAWCFMVVFATGVYFLARLQLNAARFFIYLGICTLMLFAALSLAFLIGSAVRTIQVAQIIAPFIMIVSEPRRNAVLHVIQPCWLLFCVAVHSVQRPLPQRQRHSQAVHLDQVHLLRHLRLRGLDAERIPRARV